MALVNNVKNKYREIHASAAEVLGMVLHYVTEKKHVCLSQCVSIETVSHDPI